MGFNKNEAKKMFEFESYIIKRFNKDYLLHQDFTKMWFFGLNQPFFKEYPKTKDDILREQYLTVSELCKIIDEAEWHFWNSHERYISSDVWTEITEWRLRGNGMEFATKYFNMVEKETGISRDSISQLIGEQGSHLSKYKW